MPSLRKINSKRAKRRRKRLRRAYFGEVVYYTNLWNTTKYRQFKFLSYDAALANVMSIKLGFEEPPLNKTWTLCKVLGGYTRRGKRVIERKKVFAEPKPQENLFERNSMGRKIFSSRQLSKHWNSFIAPPQNLVNANWYASGSGRASAGSSTATAVDGTGNGSWQIPTTAWDRLPFSALV